MNELPIIVEKTILVPLDFIESNGKAFIRWFCELYQYPWIVDDFHIWRNWKFYLSNDGKYYAETIPFCEEYPPKIIRVTGIGLIFVENLFL